MDQADKPATLKELNALQLDLLEKIYDSQGHIEQKLNDFIANVSPRIAVLEALNSREGEEQTAGLSRRSIAWIATGVGVSLVSSVFSIIFTLVHLHVG